MAFFFSKSELKTRGFAHFCDLRLREVQVARRISAVVVSPLTASSSSLSSRSNIALFQPFKPVLAHFWISVTACPVCARLVEGKSRVTFRPADM